MKDGWLPREEWLKTLEARPASAAVLIENSAGELLIVKAHYKPHWGVPGGVIDAGETPLQAALREVTEEVGLTLQPADLTFYAVASRHSSEAMLYQFVFRARLDNERLAAIVLADGEIETYEFVSRQAVLASDQQFVWSIQHWAEGKLGGYVETNMKRDGNQRHETATQYIAITKKEETWES